jgi:hypothetical protein
MLRALLKQLRTEGVQNISVVHFEGRGDPLMNQNLPELIDITKTVFPGCFAMVTTHASYPYKPGLAQSGLDLLRASIDGAFQDNYAKYRVGGDLEMSFAFLSGIRDERRRFRSCLQVDWKYILFEWNDSDEEIAQASRLAHTFDVSLTFVLTHTPGRSKRFNSPVLLEQKLAEIAPNAQTDSTFPLKDPRNYKLDISAAINARVRLLLSEARAAIQRCDEQSALLKITKAMESDLGTRISGTYPNITSLLQKHAAVLAKARFPSTLPELASILAESGEHALSRQFLSRYYFNAAKEDLLLRKDALAAMRLGFQSVRASAALRSRFRHWCARLLRC